MAKTAEPQTSHDGFKLAAAGVAVVASFSVFYVFPEASFFYRVLGIAGGLLVALAIFFTTGQGRTTSTFLGTARVELRRMVWPTRTETLQTTLIVFVLVMIVALFLWLLDRLLGWFMQWFIG